MVRGLRDVLICNECVELCCEIIRDPTAANMAIQHYREEREFALKVR